MLQVYKGIHDIKQGGRTAIRGRYVPALRTHTEAQSTHFIHIEMISHEINTMQKVARAVAIADYLRATGRQSCVCFTCGNASKALRKVGLQVREVLKPPRWYTLAEIQQLHNRFDATSGHISTALMMATAYNLAAMIGKSPLRDEIATAISNGTPYVIPTGSGETLVTVKMIYPLLNVVPAYNLDDSTRFSPKAPLNSLVLALAYKHEVLDYEDNSILDRVKEKLGLADTEK